MFKTDFIFRQLKIEFKPECLAWSCHYATGCFVAFLGDISIMKLGWNVKKLFCCPALELYYCLPLWKTVLFVSSRAFSLSTPTFLLSTTVENSEATRKKLQNATNHSSIFDSICNIKLEFWKLHFIYQNLEGQKNIVYHETQKFLSFYQEPFRLAHNLSSRR